MRIEIRIYKRYDTNLLALYSAGYPVGRIMVEALRGYANNNPQFYFIDEIVPFDMNDKTSVHFGINIPESDVNTIYMLQNIKHGFRNSFCKAVLRNCMVFQNLSCYFADQNLVNLEIANMNWINSMNIPNVHKLSEYERKNRQIQFLNHSVDYQNMQNAQQPYNPMPMMPSQNNYSNQQFNVNNGYHMQNNKFQSPVFQPQQPVIHQRPQQQTVQSKPKPLSGARQKADELKRTISSWDMPVSTSQTNQNTNNKSDKSEMQKHTQFQNNNKKVKMQVQVEPAYEEEKDTNKNEFGAADNNDLMDIFDSL